MVKIVFKLCKSHFNNSRYAGVIRASSTQAIPYEDKDELKSNKLTLNKTAEFDNSVIPFQTTPISHEPLSK